MRPLTLRASGSDRHDAPKVLGAQLRSCGAVPTSPADDTSAAAAGLPALAGSRRRAEKRRDPQETRRPWPVTDLRGRTSEGTPYDTAALRAVSGGGLLSAQFLRLRPANPTPSRPRAIKPSVAGSGTPAGIADPVTEDARLNTKPVPDVGARFINIRSTGTFASINGDANTIVS